MDFNKELTVAAHFATMNVNWSEWYIPYIGYNCTEETKEKWEHFLQGDLEYSHPANKVYVQWVEKQSILTLVKIKWNLWRKKRITT